MEPCAKKMRKLPGVDEMDRIQKQIEDARTASEECEKAAAQHYLRAAELQHTLNALAARREHPLDGALSHILPDALLDICHQYYDYGLCSRDHSHLHSNQAPCVCSVDEQAKDTYKSDNWIFAAQIHECCFFATESFDFLGLPFRTRLESYMFQMRFMFPQAPINVKRLRKHVIPSKSYSIAFERSTTNSRIVVYLGSSPTFAIYYPRVKT